MMPYQPNQPNFRKTLSRLFVILLLSISINLNAQTPTFDWVKEIPFYFLFGQTTDSENNVILTGGFYDTIQIGSNTLISNGESDVIIVKYNNSGALLWYKTFGGTTYDDGMDIKVDSNNDIIITVMSNLPLVIEDDTITSPSEGAHNSVIVKLSSDGEYLWAIIPGYNEYNCFHTYNSVVDKYNNVYTGGNFYMGSGVFPDTTLNYYSNGYNFVTKYDFNGEFQWVKIFEDNIVEFDVDYSGNLLVITSEYQTGYANNTIHKYNTDGNSLWSMTLDHAIPNIPDIRKNLGFDSENNFYLTAIINDTISIENKTFISYGEYDILLLKFNSEGELIWGHVMGSPGWEDFNCLFVKNNIITILGSFETALYFDEGSLVYHGSRDQGFLAQFNTDGNLLMKKQFGGEISLRPEIISYDKSIYITGYASDSTVFDNIYFEGNGNFLAKIDGVLNIEEPTINEFDIDVFPNPTMNIISISFESNFIGKIELFNLQGIKMNEYLINDSNFSINLKHLANGTYILKGTNENSTFIKKIIKL